MSQIEPQENVDYDDVFESILNDAQSRGLSDGQVWEVWQTGSKQEYNDALEWVAEWITGAQMLGHGAETIEFAKNMAMSIRAAKRPILAQSNREAEMTEKERADRLEAMIDRTSGASLRQAEILVLDFFIGKVILITWREIPPLSGSRVKIDNGTNHLL